MPYWRGLCSSHHLDPPDFNTQHRMIRQIIWIQLNVFLFLCTSLKSYLLCNESYCSFTYHTTETSHTTHNISCLKHTSNPQWTNYRSSSLRTNPWLTASTHLTHKCKSPSHKHKSRTPQSHAHINPKSEIHTAPANHQQEVAPSLDLDRDSSDIIPMFLLPSSTPKITPRAWRSAHLPLPNSRSEQHRSNCTPRSQTTLPPRRNRKPDQASRHARIPPHGNYTQTLINAHRTSGNKIPARQYPAIPLTPRTYQLAPIINLKPHTPQHH